MFYFLVVGSEDGGPWRAAFLRWQLSGRYTPSFVPFDRNLYR